MELLANKFSWKILKKIILKALVESSNLAIDEGVAAGGDADVVRGKVQQQGDDEMHSSSSSICRQNLEEEANFAHLSGLYRHIKLVHEKVKRFMCSTMQ